MSHQFIKNMKTGVLRMERSSEDIHMPITLDFHFELAEELKERSEEEQKEEYATVGKQLMMAIHKVSSESNPSWEQHKEKEEK
jgi:hypothetical protein